MSTVPHYTPKEFRSFADNAFAAIPFLTLTQEELFCLFHPKSYHNDTLFGSILLRSEEHLIVITQEIVIDYGNFHNSVRLSENINLAEQSIDQPYFSTSKKRAELRAEEIAHDKYSTQVQEQEAYNRRRLALLSREVYLEIRPKLDPEITRLGDEIFPPPSSSDS